MYADITILLITDDLEDVTRFTSVLEETHYSSVRVVSRGSSEGISVSVPEKNIAIVFYALGLTPGVAIPNLQALTELYPDSNIIMLGSRNHPETVITAIEQGAHKYLDNRKLNPLLLQRAMRFSMEKTAAMIKLEKAYAALKVSEQRFSKIFHHNQLIALVVTEGRVERNFTVDVC